MGVKPFHSSFVVIVMTLAVLLAACGGGDDTQAATTTTTAPATTTTQAKIVTTTVPPESTTTVGTAASELSVTFRPPGCTLGGQETVSAGPATITLVNETGYVVVADLHLIGDTHSYGDLASFIEEDQASIDAGGQPGPPPPWVTNVARAIFVPTAQDIADSLQVGFTAPSCWRTKRVL